MRTLADYVAAYGLDAGPKMFHTIRSRAAYKGVSTRRRHRIEALTGRPYRLRRKAVPATGPRQTMLALMAPESKSTTAAGSPPV